MLLVQNIVEDRAAVEAGLKKRFFADIYLLDEVVALDEQRKQIKYDLDETLAKLNGISKEIGDLFKSGERDKANELKEQTPVIKEQSQKLKEELDAVEAQLIDKLVLIPNVPHSSVPAGKSAEDNEVVREGGKKHELAEGAKPHWELMEQHDLVSLELGTKITGAGFPVYKGKGARLQRALIQFFLNEAGDAGYTEVIPPFMVNEDTAYGTGQLPDKEGQMYHTELDHLYLIPTAEVPVTNIHRGDLLKEEDLPIKYCAYSPCFRREAGSYGKDVRGLNRVHQFEKVEIVQFQKPELSYETLDNMVAHVEALLNKLGLHYRILRLCGGDMGFTSALTYDFEVYSTAQQRWLEVSSVSNFESFQTNRMKIRYKTADKKNQLAHTLNGSALALPRIMASIMENYQNADGSITVPEVLVPYTGFDTIG